MDKLYQVLFTDLIHLTMNEKDSCWKYTDIFDAALQTKGEERKLFVDAYLGAGPWAASNIGYFIGYYGPRTRSKLYKIFKGTSHPIFGTGY